MPHQDEREGKRCRSCERHDAGIKITSAEDHTTLKFVSIYVPPRGIRYIQQEWAETAMA